MTSGHILLQKSEPLQGSVQLVGAKNAVLVIITALILTDGISVLENVPNNADVHSMINLIEELGARVQFDSINKRLVVDTTGICRYEVRPEIMIKTRASILAMGPLLARFGKAKMALPGGDVIGTRPIDYHLRGFKSLGIAIDEQGHCLTGTLRSFCDQPLYSRIVLEYPSVGATENIMMFAVLGKGTTVIVNAAIEPEVIDLIDVLKKMGGNIDVLPGACLVIKGVQKLHGITHSIIPDRLEAGSLLLAAAMTGGFITIPNARPDHLDIFLTKLQEMGHEVWTGQDKSFLPAPLGISLRATKNPQAVSIKTGPYPGFATDLQPLMTAALCLAQGTSVIEETVYENRMIHVKELQKMGAQITVDRSKAIIRGVDVLYGCDVIATDIRTSCSLVLAGFAAEGKTKIFGLHHWQRGYDQLEQKLSLLGATIQINQEEPVIVDAGCQR